MPLFHNNIYSLNSEQYRKTGVAPYDASWQSHYEAERDKIKNVLKTINPSIHHIGSTAVPGMLAKPVIDILILLDNIHELEGQRDVLESLGYHWMGEYGITGRRYLWRVAGKEIDFHLQCFQKDHMAATNCIVFRDFLRSHPNKIIEYSKEKERASKKFPNDTHAYWYEKKNFVDKLLIEAINWHNLKTGK